MTSPLWTAEDIGKACDGTLSPFTKPQLAVTGTVHIDSRKVEAGDLFIAIEGENRDAHDFLNQVADAGGALALVHKDSHALPTVKTQNSVDAMVALAKASVARCAAPRIAITGSVGKTGTKELMRAGFAAVGQTHATEGNLNNHFGLPLTLARMHRNTEFAVLELGMNHAGEIRDLTHIAQPHVTLVTKIAAAHTEFFDSIDDIARAKAEIFEGLKQDGSGFALLNRDDPYFPMLADIARKNTAQVLSFGLHREADARLIKAEALPFGGQTLTVKVGGQDLRFDLALNGEHYGLSAAGVLLAAHVLDQNLNNVAKCMGAVQPLDGRGAVTALPDEKFLIDESYNASPVAMNAAFQVLHQMHTARGVDPESKQGRAVAILGDMLELGEEGQAMHAGLAEGLQAAKVDVLLGSGPLMQALCEKFGRDEKISVQHFANAETLAASVQDWVGPKDTILVKGSLGSGMAVVCKALKEA